MTVDIAELPPPKRSRTWGFYLVLVFAVAPLWSAIPLAWYFAVYSFYTRQWLAYSGFRKVLFFISCCEAVFSMYHTYLVHRVSGPTPCGPGDPQEIQLAYIRLLKSGLANLPADGGDLETLITDRPGSPAETIVQLQQHDPRAIDFRHALRTWFCKVPFSSIKAHHVRKWLYWAMFNAEIPPAKDLTESHKAIVDDAMALLQKRIGCKVEDGPDGRIKPILLTIDKTNIFWRPLTFYCFVGMVNWILRKVYTTQADVRHGYYNDIEYLLRVPRDWDSMTSTRPVVFLHGLGLGLLQYHRLIATFMKGYLNRPVLVLLQPQISQDFFHPKFLKPLSRHQMADSLANLLKDLGWVQLKGSSEAVKVVNFTCGEQYSVENSPPNSSKGVTILSHSNGSYSHAWMLKNYPDIVSRSCFVDPVTFCSWEGDVCYNFLYRPCMTALELLMRYFVGTELGVANVLQRHFCWTSNSLWFEEIPNARDPHKTLFLLGGKDNIVHSERVKLYLTSHGVRENIWYDPDGRHGEALLPQSPGLNKILRWLSEEETTDSFASLPSNNDHDSYELDTPRT